MGGNRQRNKQVRLPPSMGQAAQRTAVYSLWIARWIGLGISWAASAGGQVDKSPVVIHHTVHHADWLGERVRDGFPRFHRPYYN